MFVYNDIKYVFNFVILFKFLMFIITRFLRLKKRFKW